MTRIAFLLAGLASLALAAPAAAQSMDHSMHGQAPAPKPAPTPSPAPVAPPAPGSETPAEPMDHGAMQASDPDCPPEHASMGHCTPKATAAIEAGSRASGTDLPPGDATAPAPPSDWYADRIYPRAEMEHSRHEMMMENG